jgi:hypothetical protein
MRAEMQADVQKALGRIPIMLDDKKHMPLQAADMLAWNIRRQLDVGRKDKTWHWLFERLRKFITWAVKYDRSTLEALRGMIPSNG